MTNDDHVVDGELLFGGWLTTEKLATVLGVDPSTLRRWRCARPPQGPPFVRLTDRVTVYSARDIEEWIKDMRTDPRMAA